MQRQQPRIRIGRVYDERAPADGARVLVDRLWPRGMTRDRADLDDPRRADALDHLREVARQRTLTLLTATRHVETSEAAVLADMLAARTGSR